MGADPHLLPAVRASLPPQAVSSCACGSEGLWTKWAHSGAPNRPQTFLPCPAPGPLLGPLHLQPAHPSLSGTTPTPPPPLASSPSPPPWAWPPQLLSLTISLSSLALLLGLCRWLPGAGVFPHLPPVPHWAQPGSRWAGGSPPLASFSSASHPAFLSPLQLCPPSPPPFSHPLRPRPPPPPGPRPPPPARAPPPASVFRRRRRSRLLPAAAAPSEAGAGAGAGAWGGWVGGERRRRAEEGGRKQAREERREERKAGGRAGGRGRGAAPTQHRPPPPEPPSHPGAGEGGEGKGPWPAAAPPPAPRRCRPRTPIPALHWGGRPPAGHAAPGRSPRPRCE